MGRVLCLGSSRRLGPRPRARLTRFLWRFVSTRHRAALGRPVCVISPKGCFLAVPSSLSGPLPPLPLPSPTPSFLFLGAAGFSGRNSNRQTDRSRFEELINTIPGRGNLPSIPPPVTIQIANPILPSSPWSSRGDSVGIRQWTVLELMGWTVAGAAQERQPVRPVTFTLDRARGGLKRGKSVTNLETASRRHLPFHVVQSAHARFSGTCACPRVVFTSCNRGE